MQKNKYLLLAASFTTLLLLVAAAGQEQFGKEGREIQAPGEELVTGLPVLHRHRPVAHDPAEYGCTVCHGGQGLATEKADAHGDVDFWPQPMLPRGMSQAGCGTCHAHVAIPSADALAASRAVFERRSCLVCHRVDG